MSKLIPIEDYEKVIAEKKALEQKMERLRTENHIMQKGINEMIHTGEGESGDAPTALEIAFETYDELKALRDTEEDKSE